MFAYGSEQSFLEKLSIQTDLIGAGKLLAAAAADLGWDRAAFHSDMKRALLPRDDDGELVAVAMGWSADYVTGWMRRNLASHCPVTRQCGRASDSFAWECDPDGASWEGQQLTTEQRQVIEYYGECAGGAITVPVHRPGGKTGYVSWFLRNEHELPRLFRETYTATHVISHAFMHHLARLERAQSGDGGNVLTARELECLGWAAQGKTEEEIGAILGRSRETANFHLGNAMRKLNASNRTHAVAIACSRGLITVV